MATITETRMTSDQTPHTARRVGRARTPDGPERWRVSWLPDVLLTRSQATTSILLAELANAGPLVDSWAAELGLTGADALERIGQPPHALDRRLHTLSTSCWCEPLTAFDGHLEADGSEPLFAATDAIDKGGRVLQVLR